MPNARKASPLIIPYIVGDGIGPDIWRAAHLVFTGALEKYARAQKVEWRRLVLPRGGTVPRELVREIYQHKVAIKGPLETPVGSGIRSLNVLLRKTFDLYATVRPIFYIPGVPSPVRHPEKVNMVVFRENLEDVYAGIEFRAGSKEAKALRVFLEKQLKVEVRSGSGIGIKPISKTETERLARRALRYAIEHGRKNVTIVHKGNIMKFTEGAFAQWGYNLARREFQDKVSERAARNKILLQDRIADAFFQEILLKPQNYDVIVTTNLNGDYLSDALAAQVGGIGLVPSANFGDHVALFETTHGTAPRYAGKNAANPSALILSGSMLFEHCNMTRVARAIRTALEKTIAQKYVTADLARSMRGARKCSTSRFAEHIAKNL